MGGCNVVATEHGRYSLSCMQKLHVSSAGSVWYVGSFKLCCKILLLLIVDSFVHYIMITYSYYYIRFCITRSLLVHMLNEIC